MRLERVALTAALVIAGCAGQTPMRWEKPGDDAASDEAACRAAARDAAIRLYPYGNGPPIYGMYRQISMIEWTREIDTARYYAEEEFTRQCMRSRGYQLVPAVSAGK